MEDISNQDSRYIHLIPTYTSYLTLALSCPQLMIEWMCCSYYKIYDNIGKAQ